MTEKELETELKAIKIKLNEVYEWMELTQTGTIDILANKIIKLQDEIKELKHEYDIRKNSTEKL